VHLLELEAFAGGLPVDSAVWRHIRNTGIYDLGTAEHQLAHVLHQLDYLTHVTLLPHMKKESRKGFEPRPLPWPWDEFESADDEPELSPREAFRQLRVAASTMNM